MDDFQFLIIINFIYFEGLSILEKEIESLNISHHSVTHSVTYSVDKSLLTLLQEDIPSYSSYIFLFFTNTISHFSQSTFNTDNLHYNKSQHTIPIL